VKKQSLPKTKPWKTYGIAAYLAQAENLATHTTKGVNTNAAGDGVRVSPGNRNDIPYACVLSEREPVELDYTNGATASPITEQIDAVLKDDFHRFSGVDEAECATIRERVLPVLEQPMIAGPSVSPRLRQIIVEDSQSGDIVLTPLHSGGFSLRLKAILEAELEATLAETGKSTTAFFDDVVMKVGGDKGQNAGRMHLIGAMQNAYRFAVPLKEEDPGIRKAISVWHRGISLRIPYALLEEYASYLNKLQYSDKQKGLPLQRTQRRMDKEAVHIAAMVKHLLDRADRNINLLRPYVGNILEGFCSPDLPLLQRGLLDKGLRDDQWKTIFAESLAQNIASAKTRDGVLVVGISGRSASFLKPYILELLS